MDAREDATPRSTRAEAPAAGPSVDLDSATELLILVTDELDQLLVGHEALIDADRPWFRVCLRIIDRQVDLQVSERRPTDALGEPHLLTVRTAVHVEPAVVRAVFGAAQVVGFDNQRVSLPASDGVPVPPRLRFALRRERAAVQV